MKQCLKALLYLGSAAVTVFLLLGIWNGRGTESLAQSPDTAQTVAESSPLDAVVEQAVTELLSSPKTYWLSDDEAAPEPAPDRYGTAADPAELQWLLEEAATLLDGQELYFSTETEPIPGTEVTYYLDETIFAITWKEQIDGMTYTIAEVKIADASQFRRFLAGGEYGSDLQLTTSEMAAQANAVVASAGDFYTYRNTGITVYEGALHRMEGRQLDTCFVDRNGDLLLIPAGELTTAEAVNAFLAEHDVRFSLAFGPILIKDGKRCEPYNYPLGEPKGYYARAGIGQLGQLHYILTTVNGEFFHLVPNISQFAAGAERFGCDQFYVLDGGQTATIAMNDRVINCVDYGGERAISDIIYFATALPSGG